MKHCEDIDSIGIFDYSDDFELFKENRGIRLYYIGSESDGSKITIPDGIKCCEGMFARCNLTEPPVIPESVEDCRYMFYRCSSLKRVPKIPKNVGAVYGMFEGCTSLEDIPKLHAGIWDKELIGCSFTEE